MRLTLFTRLCFLCALQQILVTTSSSSNNNNYSNNNNKQQRKSSALLCLCRCLCLGCCWLQHFVGAGEWGGAVLYKSANACKAANGKGRSGDRWTEDKRSVSKWFTIVVAGLANRSTDNYFCVLSMRERERERERRSERVEESEREQQRKTERSWQRDAAMFAHTKRCCRFYTLLLWSKRGILI